MRSTGADTTARFTDTRRAFFGAVATTVPAPTADAIHAVAKSSTFDPAVVGPMQAVAARHFPEMKLLPLMSTGATDGIFLEAIGIPVDGVPGVFIDKDMSGIHGLDEKIGASLAVRGRDCLFGLVKAYGG